MIKVALISPRGNVFGLNDKMSSFLKNSEYMKSFKFFWTGPNLGLLTIASLFPTEWECEYIDENYAVIDFDKKYDIVCVSAMTQQIQNAYRICSAYREKGVLTVIGGIHATIMYKEALEYADVVMAGEGETLIPCFIKDFYSGYVKRLYTDKNPGTYDLRKSPLPRYELLKGYQYPIISIQTTRGCPHDCSFCAASKVFGSKYRRKENSQIIEELYTISKQYPDTLILFSDDNAFVHRERCKELLRDMAGLGLRWIAQTDISIANDDELLKLMVLSGCQWIVIGFESVLYDSLYNLDKTNWKLKQLPRYDQSINKIQSYGIGIYGTFIVGLDSDEQNIFQAVTEFILRNNLYGANITLPTPLPGTRLRDDLIKEGRVLDKDWSYYTFWDITIQPKHFTITELEDGVLWIYRQITDKISVEKRLAVLRGMARKRGKIIRQNNAVCS